MYVKEPGKVIDLTPCLRRRAALLDGLGEYGGALCRTLEDAGRANPELEVVFSED